MSSSSMHTMTNKGGAGELETAAMANCLMILSTHAAAARTTVAGAKPTMDPTFMFSCKTCDRKFPTFQALGGHRASHKKIKPAAISDAPAAPKTPKTHACSICGQEFLIGQALGGHMRRHRQLLSSSVGGGSTVTTEGSMENSDGVGSNCKQKKRKNNDIDDLVLPMMMPAKLSVSKRICLDFDLNFMPVGKFEKEEDEEIEEGEIVEEKDFLRLELRQPINC